MMRTTKIQTAHIVRCTNHARYTLIHSCKVHYARYVIALQAVIQTEWILDQIKRIMYIHGI